MSMLKFSVLMSVYSGDEPLFLKLALKSIYEDQTIKPDQIVLVIDGPISEELKGAVSSFVLGKEKIVKVVQLEKNMGLGEALRRGLDACDYDVVCRMDSDDISVSNRFEVLLDYFEKHPNIDVLGSDIAEFREDPDEKKKRIRSCPQEHKNIVKMAKQRTPMNHVSVCMKKDAVIKSGGYIPLSYVEDYYLWLRMIQCGYVFENIKEPLVYVRTGNGFYKRRSSKTKIESWKTIQKFLYEQKMCSRFRCFWNMLSFRIFLIMPLCFKRFIYARFLRRWKKY